MARSRPGLIAAAIACSSLLAVLPARAAPASTGAADVVRGAAEAITPLQESQYVWRGRRYCWYWDGWRGPGWYWCGYAWRRGHGWGGPVGWRGWRRPAVRPPRPGPGRFYRGERPGRPGARPGRPGEGRFRSDGRTTPRGGGWSGGGGGSRGGNAPDDRGGGGGTFGGGGGGGGGGGAAGGGGGSGGGGSFGR